ncbi:MAG TPA: hypothetical protein VFU49_05700 [Ktedonobacteraceae bacterium]|nr:hypothetical protein [Ktedonobacteraceae bacterium]
MPTIEERLQTLEQEHTELKRSNTELQKAVELMNIALGALVNKATLEKVNEQNNKIFDTLIRHDQFTNQQLAELRGQFTELDGKVVGLQTEMRQRFTEQDSKIAGLDSKIAGLQTTQAEHTTLLKQILARLPE